MTVLEGSVVGVKVVVAVGDKVIVGVAVGGALLTEIVVIKALKLRINIPDTATRKIISPFFVILIPETLSTRFNN